MTAGYPRNPDERERGWIGWILPADRPGYREVREALAPMVVVGEGRRGAGEVILGPRGSAPDFSSPLGSVFAYGAIETEIGLVSVTLREITDGQASLEIVAHRAEEVPAAFTELRRWTYSTWDPGTPCPQCGEAVREAVMAAGAAGAPGAVGAPGKAGVPGKAVPAGGRQIVLAICARDRRIWVHDTRSRVNRLVPVTNFYNELMLRKNIRDPKTALDASHLFAEPGRWSDEDLAAAFAGYNRLRAKVPGGIAPPRREEPRGLRRIITSLFRKPS